MDRRASSTGHCPVAVAGEGGGRVASLAEQERRDFADLLEGLAPEQWRAPTLCSRWNVRVVVAYVLSYEGLGPLAL